MNSTIIELSEQQHANLQEVLQTLLKETSDVVKIPGEFVDSVEKLGAHRAICDFLKPEGGFPSELLKLHHAGNLPQSIEALVLQPEWKEFFDEHLLIEASNRLQEISSVID